MENNLNVGDRVFEAFEAVRLSVHRPQTCCQDVPRL